MNLPTFLTKNYHCQYILVQVQASEQIVFDFFLGGGIKIYSKKSFIALITGPRQVVEIILYFVMGRKTLGKLRQKLMREGAAPLIILPAAGSLT